MDKKPSDLERKVEVDNLEELIQETMQRFRSTTVDLLTTARMAVERKQR
jgi:hypothetical protein